MTGAISARHCTIGDLLSEHPRLQVPGYQRPYGWSIEHADRLLDDVLDAMDRGSAGAGQSYFLGSIILAGADGAAALDIVDGQQRLVTVTIMLALLRDLAPTGAARAAGVAGAIADGAGSPRLVPRLADAEFFARFVQAPGAAAAYPDWWGREGAPDDGDAVEAAVVEESDDEDAFLGEPATTEPGADEPMLDVGSGRTADEVESAAAGESGRDDVIAPREAAPVVADSQRHMLEARERLRGRLAALPAEGEGSRAALARFLLGSCVVVVIRVTAADEAYRVFCVMNTRGERLTETDILKAEVLGAIAEPGVRRSCQVIWEDCEAMLGRAELDNLLSHIRMIGLKRRQRRSVVEEIREHYAPLREPEAFVDNVLQPHAAVLAQVIAADLRIPGADEAQRVQIARFLTYLGWLPNTSWRPAVLAFVQRHGDDAAAVLRFLKALDRLAYGMLILKRDEGERLSKYRQILEAIEGERSLFSPRSSALRLDRRSREIILSRLSGGYFGIQSFAGVVLRRLDGELLRDPLPDYDGATIEHVLPRNPARRSDWLRWYPGDEIDPAKGVTENCQRLGNLVLLSPADNLKAANRSPAEKWEVYFGAAGTSPFGLKAQIRDIRPWNRRALDAVHARRVARMAHIWGLGTERAKEPVPAATLAASARA